VGTKNPNQLGLYDCSGNVWEWCYDTLNVGSLNPNRNKYYVYDINSKNRKLRGGSWYNLKQFSSVEFKSENNNSFNQIKNTGFRIVRTI